jgi:hypothetical protein
MTGTTTTLAGREDLISHKQYRIPLESPELK